MVLCTARFGAGLDSPLSTDLTPNLSFAARTSTRWFVMSPAAFAYRVEAYFDARLFSSLGSSAVVEGTSKEKK